MFEGSSSLIQYEHISQRMHNEHISQRMHISGECEAWIYKQSLGFFLKAKWVEKRSDLMLTEIDNTLWPVFGQEQSSDWTSHKDRLRWLKRKSRQRTADILWDAGSAWTELIHTVATAGGASYWGQPGGSYSTTACQERSKLTHTHMVQKRQSIWSSWSCHDATIQNTFNGNWNQPCLASNLRGLLSLLQVT